MCNHQSQFLNTFIVSKRNPYPLAVTSRPLMGAPGGGGSAPRLGGLGPLSQALFWAEASGFSPCPAPDLLDAWVRLCPSEPGSPRETPKVGVTAQWWPRSEGQALSKWGELGRRWP